MSAAVEGLNCINRRTLSRYQPHQEDVYLVIFPHEKRRTQAEGTTQDTISFWVNEAQCKNWHAANLLWLYIFPLPLTTTATWKQKARGIYKSYSKSRLYRRVVYKITNLVSTKMYMYVLHKSEPWVHTAANHVNKLRSPSMTGQLHEKGGI
jgi:hypothetical protein